MDRFIGTYCYVMLCYYKQAQKTRKNPGRVFKCLNLQRGEKKGGRKGGKRGKRGEGEEKRGERGK